MLLRDAEGPVWGTVVGQSSFKSMWRFLNFLPPIANWCLPQCLFLPRLGEHVTLNYFLPQKPPSVRIKASLKSELLCFDVDYPVLLL